MLDVIIALLPALIASGYFFGFRAFILILISVVSCMVFEYLARKALKKDNTIGDLSAVVTGILLAFNLPATAPWWVPIIGSFIAIVVAKQLFGGLGKNFMNPALIGRIFLMASFADIMTNWSKTTLSWAGDVTADAVSAATPLASLKSGKLPNESTFMLLLGDRAGCLGETSALLLIAGGLYLLLRRVITWQTPVAYIGTVAILTFLTAGDLDRFQFMMAHLLSGGLLLGAFFMATDYATTPVTGKGRFIFGVGCGLLTVLIRYFGGYPEGVSFSIVLMNLMTWFIDKYTRPRAYGGGAANAKN